MEATMLAPPSLLSRPNGRVLGAAAGTGPNDVVLTIESRGVFVHDALTQACRCNWAVSPGTALSGAAVVHPHARRYTVVVDRSSLCGWHEDDREFGTARMRLGTPVHALLRLGPHATAAVHADGAVTLVDASLGQRSFVLPLPPTASGAASAGCRCVWAGVVEHEPSDAAANPARHAGGELLVLIVEAPEPAPVGREGRAPSRRGAAEAAAGASAEHTPALQLHVLRAGRAGGAADGRGDARADAAHANGLGRAETETGDSAEPVALPSLERLTGAGGISLADAAPPGRALASAAVSLADGGYGDGDAAEPALRVALCWRGGFVSALAVDVAGGRAQLLDGGAWAAAGGEGPGQPHALALALAPPYFALVRAAPAAPGGGGGGGGGDERGEGPAEPAGRALDVSVFEYRCGTLQCERRVDLPPGAARLLGGAGADGPTPKRRRGGAAGAAGAAGAQPGNGGAAEAGGVMEALCLSADRGHLALCSAEVALILAVRLPELTLAQILRAPRARAALPTAAHALPVAPSRAHGAAPTGAGAGRPTALARGWPLVQLRLSSADLLDALAAPTAIPEASVGAWRAALGASAHGEAAALGRALAALAELAARGGGGGAAPSPREVESKLAAAIFGTAAGARAGGGRVARGRAAPAAAPAAPHPLSSLSSQAVHVLLRAACEEHAGTALLRSLARALLPRQAISAPALPQLLPALLGGAALAPLENGNSLAGADHAPAGAAEDAHILDALSAYITYAVEIPEAELVRALRWLLPRAAPDRLASAAADGEMNGEDGGAAAGAPPAAKRLGLAGAGDDAGEGGADGAAAEGARAAAADGAYGAAAAPPDPADRRANGPTAHGSAARLPARALGLLARVCACEKSDEPLLLALSALRPEEATEMLAQLTVIIRRYAAKWHVDKPPPTAAGSDADADMADEADAELAAEEAAPRRAGRLRPNLWQVADWACALVDAHLVPFALHADAHAHVRALSVLVGRHVRLNRAVQRLHGCLAQLIKSAAAPHAAAPVPEYCVEVASW